MAFNNEKELGVRSESTQEKKQRDYRKNKAKKIKRQWRVLDLF